AEFGFGTGVVALPVTENHPEAVVGIWVLGLESDGRAEFGDGLVPVDLGAQGAAELEVGCGVVGLEPNSLTAGGHGRFPGLARLSGQPPVLEEGSQAGQMPRVAGT